MALQDWQKIITGALKAVDPEHLVRENLRIEKNRLFIKSTHLDLNTFRNLHVIGVGKGATYLFKGLNQVLGDRISGGIIVSLPAHAFKHPKVKSIPGSHPVPDQSSLKAGQAVARYVQSKVKEEDLVFFLITGGASALMVQPVEGISLKDKMEVNQLLLDCGAEISEINCVRKRISALKGGKLARLIHPARVTGLVISDVIDSPLGDIGSGPTVPDNASVTDAFRILKKYNLSDGLPEAVKGFFAAEVKRESLRKSPSLAEAYPGLAENTHFLLADNRIALEAARAFAESMGIDARIITSRDKGEAAEAAKIYAAIIKEIIYTKTPFSPPVMLLSGGELTVTLKPKPGTRKISGQGGRNQEFVLQMLKELRTVSHPFIAASVGTDGIDGPTDAAGAWIDQKTITTVKEKDLDIDAYLENHDSYNFFKKINQLVKTGPTNTNVMDLRLFYIPRR
jgi:glycerate-2-kinase